MKTKRIKVAICWRLPEEGGRTTIINGFHYRPTIHIENDSDDRDWSFPLEFYSLPRYEQPTIAEGGFLTETCPWEKMTKGKKFTIQEGTRVIGYGTVIEPVRELEELEGRCVISRAITESCVL